MVNICWERWCALRKRRPIRCLDGVVKELTEALLAARHDVQDALVAAQDADDA